MLNYSSLIRKGLFHIVLKGEGPHLVDEHDGENGLVDELGCAAEQKERQRRRGQRGHLAQHVAKMGTECGNSKVGESSTKFDLREALDSLQYDIELSSLAGTNRNSCGLKKESKTDIFRSSRKSFTEKCFLYKFLQVGRHI